MSKYNSNVGKERIMRVIKKEGARVHFIGVGGVGMYSLFRLTERLGCIASGSERERSRLTDILSREGKRISIAHKKENVIDATLAVYTLAVSEDNPEIVYARENSIPTVSRAEYLGALMEEYKERIGVSGTHGKSTTAAMIDRIFQMAKKEPTTVLGAIIPGEEEPLRAGAKDYFIYEACEYKDSFLKFSPTASVFTNLELDHVDYFKNVESLKESFLCAMDSSPMALINCDDANLRSLMKRTKARCVSFGMSEDADYRVRISESRGGFYSFKILHKGRDVADVSLKVPGKFNVMNAAAAVALSLEFGVARSDIESALSDFYGVGRRLEPLVKYNGAQIYYDYAHHPTEIKCAINAVREIHQGRLAVIFKPHTYSRTAAFMDEFASALSLADDAFICEVSGVRENDTFGINSYDLVSKIGSGAKYVTDEGGVSNLFDKSYAAIVIMGAANLDAVINSFLRNSEK